MTRGFGIAALVIGAIALAIGAATLAQGLATAPGVAQMALRLQAETLLGGGFACLLAGAALLALDGIHQELRGLRADARAPATTRPASRPPAELPPAPDWTGPALPPRIEMVQRHGEAIGGRAWDIIRLARQRGETVTETAAVAQARQEAGHG